MQRFSSRCCDEFSKKCSSNFLSCRNRCFYWKTFELVRERLKKSRPHNHKHHHQHRCSPVTLNPVKQAFEDLGVLTSGRSSWDPIAVLIAVRGIHNAFLKEQTVSVQVAESGKETFETVSDSNQTRVYFENDQDKVSVRILLDNLLCDQPGPSSNLLWTKALG